MPGFLTERRPFFLLLGLLAFNFILMSSRVRSGGEGSLLGQAVLAVSSPFLRAAAAIGRGTTYTWYRYIELQDAERRNRELRDDVTALSMRVHELEEMQLEVGRLRTLLELRDQLVVPSTAARVIALGTTESARTLLLNRGEQHGVRINDPVITTRGVVGRVMEVAPSISKVQTLADPNSGIAALIQRTRVQGLVVGEGDRGCRMEYVMELSDIEVGDVIITSGLDQMYPKGYMIGVVTELGEGEGLTRFVGVRPEVDFRRLEEVLILHNATASTDLVWR
jgi:rod shape-determining protein MreC